MEDNQDEIKIQTEDINQSKKQKANISIKKPIPIIISIVLIVIIILSGLFFIIGRKNNNFKNYSLIFDENKPIPIKFENNNNLYGYISPRNGEVIIPANFVNATPFYGNYATVSYKDGDSTKYGLIDKHGKVKLSANSNTDIKILSEYGLYIVNNTLYNHNLKAITDEKTAVTYENLGYCYYNKGNKSITELEQNLEDEELNSNNESPKFVEAGIINPKGKKIYTYKFKNGEAYFDCSIEDKNESLKESYGVITVTDENDISKYAIINLLTGKLVYDFTDKYISAYYDNIFNIFDEKDDENLTIQTLCFSNNKIAYETTDDVDISYYDYDKNIIEIENNSKDYSEKYSYYNLNTKTFLDNRPENDNNETFSILTGYYEFSENDKYGIRKNNKQILPAEYDNIQFLPLSTFNYLKEKKHVEYILAKKDKEYQLINLKNKKVVASFSTNYITLSSTSTFIKCRLIDSNNYFAYNLLTGKSSSFESSKNVTIFSNYITVNDEDNDDLVYYNTDLKEIYKN